MLRREGQPGGQVLKFSWSTQAGRGTVFLDCPRGTSAGNDLRDILLNRFLMASLQRGENFGRKLARDRRMLQEGQVLSGEVRACEGSECSKPGRMVKLRILQDFLFTKTS